MDFHNKFKLRCDLLHENHNETNIAPFLTLSVYIDSAEVNLLANSGSVAIES